MKRLLPAAVAAFACVAAPAAAVADTAREVVVTNMGAKPLTVASLAVSGASAADHTAAGCTAVVAPGASCTLTVVFVPAVGYAGRGSSEAATGSRWWRQPGGRSSTPVAKTFTVVR